MEDKIIDLGILHESEGKEFNLEDFYTLLERKKMELYMQSVNPSNIESLENNLTNLDRLLHDLKGSKNKVKQQLLSESSRTLSTWYESVKDVKFDKELTIGLSERMKELSDQIKLVNESHIRNQNEIEASLSALETYYKSILHDNPSKKVKSSYIVGLLKKDIPKKEIIPQHIFEKLEHSLYSKDEKIDFIPLYSWELKIKINSIDEPHKAFYFLWTLTESINKINGTKLTILDIQKGSILLKIKIFFKDLLARKETKELLGKAYESGKAIIDKPTLEGKKIQQETELLEKQTQTIINPELQKERDRLENLKLQAEIEKTKAEVVNLKIDGLQKLSSIMKDGILSIDSLQMDINGEIFLVKNKNIIEQITDIDKIDSKTNFEKGN